MIPPKSPVELAVEALEAARSEIVLAIAFLGRDQGTDRLRSTVAGLLTRLPKADAAALDALAALQALPVRQEEGAWQETARVWREEYASENRQRAVNAEQRDRAEFLLAVALAALTAPLREEGEERAATQRDIDWLRGMKDSGHCGEGTLERRSRDEWNDRIDRLLSTLQGEGDQGLGRSRSQPCTDGAPDPILTETQRSDEGAGQCSGSGRVWVDDGEAANASIQRDRTEHATWGERAASRAGKMQASADAISWSLSELERLQALVGRLGRLAANSAYNIRQPEALYDMTDCYRAFQEIADEARQALLVEGGG